MFQEEYRKAYDQIRIDQAKLQELWMRAKEDPARSRGRLLYLLRPMAAPVLSFCFVCMMALPVLAKQLPAVYQVIQKYAPALAEYVLPEDFSDTSQEITLQVEAIHVQENTAEVIVSFRDAEGSRDDQIHGKVDLYDSYRIENYGETGVIGGCSFLEYDATQDKAYFKIDITSDHAFDKNKVKLAVTRLLTHCVEEERTIPLANRIDAPREKIVEYNGGGGTIRERGRLPFFTDGENPSGRSVRVMEEAERNASLLNALTVTGVAYDEGVLRVQQSRGSFDEADRHIRLYLKDGEGNERAPDCSVSWKEEIEGEEALFDESWFLISEEELKQYELYGMFCITDGSVKGNWEITVNLGE